LCEIIMNYFRWLFLSATVGLLVSCTTMREPAPIVDRASGMKPAMMFEGKPGYYIVKQGDTVMQVSRNTGQKREDIVAWNSLSNPNALNVGQVLRVAPPGPDGAMPVAQAEAPVAVSTGGVASRTVEMTPLVLGGGTAAGVASASDSTNKTQPRGEKQAYSESTLAAMQQSDYTAPLPTEQPVSKWEPQKPVSAAAVSGQDAVSWQWPADGKIVSNYSDKKSRGIDIAGVMGQPVKAAANGKVIYAGPMRDGGYGNAVVLLHSDTLISVYGHNKTVLVKQGDAVAQGQQIAEMGNSSSNVVKLRFEIRRNSKAVDPLQYLPRR
jgi:lipoprotein NlpD